MAIPYRFRRFWTRSLTNSVGRLNLDFVTRSIYAGAAWLQFSRWCWTHKIPDGKQYASRDILFDTVVREEGLELVPIIYLEFGVYKGGSLKWWVERVRHPESRFVGFDTFRGLPEDWYLRCPEGTFGVNGALPEIQDPRCSFQVGLFQDTLPKFVDRIDKKTRIVVHIDCDLFTSTLVVLGSLASKFKRGDILFFDELAFPADEFLAFDNFTKSYRLGYEVVGANNGFMRVCLKVL